MAEKINHGRRGVLKVGGAAALATLLPGCGTMGPAPAGQPQNFPQFDPLMSEIRGAQLFDDKAARQNIATAICPIIYERNLLRMEKLGADKQTQDQVGKQLIRKSLPEDVEFSVFRHDNVTAVVTYDKKNASIRVAFDATEEQKDWNDNGNIFAHPLSGGRTVHSGYYFELDRRPTTKPLSATNPTIYTAVKEQIAKYAAMQEKEENKDVTLNMNGFSKGGSVSLLMLDKMMDENKFPDNLKLGNWQTFGSPAFANDAWNKAFEAKCQKHGITGTRVVVCNDQTPELTTKKYVPFSDFKLTDNVVYLMPNATSSSRMIWVNPKDAELTEYDNEKAKLTNLPYPHDPDWYAMLLGTTLNVATAGLGPNVSNVTRFERPVSRGDDNRSMVLNTKTVGMARN